MIRYVERYILAILLLVAVTQVVLIFRIDRLSAGVDKLSAVIDRHPELVMATQTFTFGNTSIGRPIETTWVEASTGDTIVVHVYKQSSGQSFGDQQAFSNSSVTSVAATHPGN